MTKKVPTSETSQNHARRGRTRAREVQVVSWVPRIERRRASRWDPESARDTIYSRKKHRVDDENRYREAWRWPRARASTHRCGRARNATRPPRLMAAEKGPCCKGAQERWAKALYSTRSGAQGLSADAGGRERGDPDGGSGRSRLPGSATAVAQRIRTRGSRNDVVAQQLPHMEHRRREECRFLTRPV